MDRNKSRPFASEEQSRNELDPANSQPIAEALSARIRGMILQGEFVAGQHLREVHLAEMFGSSRTPVRLALASNEKDGLLEYRPNRGYVVRPFDAKDLESAVEIRALIEGMAARKAAEKGLDSDRFHKATTAIADVDNFLRGDNPIDDSTLELWRMHNEAYHQAIIEQSDNRFIQPTLLNVRQIPGFYPLVFEVHDRAVLHNFNEQHRQILTCIENREGVRAEFLMREHIYSAGMKLLAVARRTHAAAASRNSEDSTDYSNHHLV